ncbi:MAG: response regulator [Bacteroidetes bacterium]|nr:response regulator [Bacteroidota bacterium]
MKKKKILIIEDDITLRENLTDFLNEEGYDVRAATDGLTGLKLTIKQLPDLILCDIMMQGMNGIEFFKTIQQINATSAIPLIFITAKSEKKDIRAGMHLGADDYITKPFDLNELHLAIKTRLAKQERFQKAFDEKFYALIDNPLLGVFIYSENKFEYVNDTFAKMFDLTIYDFEKMNFSDIIVDKSGEYVLEKIRKCLNGSQECIQEKFEAFKKDQKKMFIEIYANLINFKGSPALVGNAVDISKKEKNINVFKIADNSDNLTKREIEILKQVCMGLSTEEIAATNYISIRTVGAHRAKLLKKTESKNSTELILYALRKKIISID